MQKRVNLDFCQKSSENLKIQIYRTLFTLFLVRQKKYCIKTLCPANGFEIGQKAKKGHRFENLSHKITTENPIFYQFFKILQNGTFAGRKAFF